MKKKKSIYEAVHDGMFSSVIEHKVDSYGYDYAFNRVEYGSENFSYNRAKMIKTLRTQLKRDIEYLKDALKTLK